MGISCFCPTGRLRSVSLFKGIIGTIDGWATLIVPKGGGIWVLCFNYDFTIQLCFNDATMFQLCSNYATMLQLCLNYVSTMVQLGFNDVSTMFQLCFDYG